MGMIFDSGKGGNRVFDGKAGNKVFSSGHKMGGKRGEPLDNLPVGSSVFISINGISYEWIIVRHTSDSVMNFDYKTVEFDPSYWGYELPQDAGAWLLMKNIWGYEYFSKNTGYCFYEYSYLHGYLNEDFYSMVNSSVKTKIAEVQIPCVSFYNWYNSSFNFKYSKLSTKIFLPSAYEMYGRLSTNNLRMAREGVYLPFFNTDGANQKKATYNGTAVEWPTRSPYPYYNTGPSDALLGFDASGFMGLNGNNYQQLIRYTDNGRRKVYVRPMMIMTNSAEVDSEYYII